MEEVISFDGDAQLSCPECRSALIFDTFHGEYVCQSCGYVVIDRINFRGHEAQATNSDDSRKSVRGSGNTSFLLVNRGLQTEIGVTNRDYTGRPISYETIPSVSNIRRLHSRLKATSEERRISRVLSAIDKICSKMLLPRSLSEAAAKIYRNYASKNNTKGSSVWGNAIAAVYLACKQSGVARGLEEIVSSSDFSSGKGSMLRISFRCCRKMMMCMTDIADDEANETCSLRNAFDSSIPINRYIAKVSNRAGIDWRVQRLAMGLAEQTGENSTLFLGKDPAGVAAAYLYISACICGYNMYLTDIANFSKVTEITIRTRCREILSSYNLEIRVKRMDRTTGT
ncbi:MAG TPA: TFIIB-type zinc ribbon-containing protein [Nitrososphaera sp.]|nr:TFIIB-type zinc ribbon-containing protein [Nitrososphaera sp.]